MVWIEKYEVRFTRYEVRKIHGWAYIFGLCRCFHPTKNNDGHLLFFPVGFNHFKSFIDWYRLFVGCHSLVVKAYVFQLVKLVHVFFIFLQRCQFAVFYFVPRTSNFVLASTLSSSRPSFLAGWPLYHPLPVSLLQWLSRPHGLAAPCLA